MPESGANTTQGCFCCNEVTKKFRLHSVAYVPEAEHVRTCLPCHYGIHLLVETQAVLLSEAHIQYREQRRRVGRREEMRVVPLRGQTLQHDDQERSCSYCPATIPQGGFSFVSKRTGYRACLACQDAAVRSLRRARVEGVACRRCGADPGEPCNNPAASSPTCPVREDAWRHTFQSNQLVPVAF